MKLKIFLIFVLGLVIGICLKFFVVDIVKVSGVSMEPAIMSGSIVVINKLAYGIAAPFGSELLVQWAEPKKGDIVSYFYNNKMIIKRCVGIGGEALDFSSDSQYSISVNEEKYPLSEQQYQRIKFNSVVPKNTILVIGDNAGISVDSRDYGFISVNNILGKVMHK